MDYDSICNDIIDLDPLIRFVAIMNPLGEKVAGGFRNGVSSLLNPDEVKMSMHYALQRWEARGNLSHRIGDAKYSTTAYEKVKQITMPINKTDLLLISVEPNANQIQIIDRVLGLIKKN